MNTTTAPGLFEELIFEREASDDGQYHGCHTECQLDRDRPVMACGAESEWVHLQDTSPLPKCPGCWGESVYCPVCGVKLAACPPS